jgi:hypothetical protein
MKIPTVLLVAARLLLLIGGLTLPASSQAQAVFYVRAGAAGASNGSDWNNAFPSLPSVLQRGATYYIADGSYGAYTFGTPESGSTVITIKKATIADHGTDVGWNDSYGDGQAVFSALLHFRTSNWVFDGATRNEANWFDGNSYGFRVNFTDLNQQIKIGTLGGAPAHNVTLRHVFISAPTSLPNSTIRQYAIDTESATLTRNIVISRCGVYGGNNTFFIRNTEAPIVEYCAAERQRNNDYNHAETFNLYYNVNNAILRYNQVRDFCTDGSRGTAVVAITYSGGLQFYGNVISDFASGDGVVGYDGAYSHNNRIYNNTFIRGVNGNSGLAFGAGTNNIIRNNLWINCSYIAFMNGAKNHDYNGFTGSNAYGEPNAQINISTSIFANFNGGDFRLVAPTAAGVSLGAPFNVDLRGTARGADGTWDRGAYEYAANVPPDTNAPSVTLSAPAAGAVVSNVVTLSATATDNTGVAGVRFYVNNAEVADDTTSPYSFSWDSTLVTNGQYRIAAQARDFAANVAWSATNTITVSNPPVIIPPPTVYWHFNEGGGTTATDAISGNVLTLRNGTAWTPGRFGTALILDGIDDRADAPHSSSLSITGAAITVSAWVNLQNQGTWQQILVKVKEVGAFTSPYFAWHLFGGHVSSTQWVPQFQVVNSSGVSVNITSSQAVNYGQWVHAVGVYDGTAVRIYVNGVLRGSAALTGNMIAYNQPLYLGAHGLPGEFAKGAIDEVRIYPVALSAAQVQALYDSAPSTFPAPPTGLRILQE